MTQMPLAPQVAPDDGAPDDARPRPRVVLVHDYLTQQGGAERVMLELARAFPGSEVRTTLYTPQTTFEGFQDVSVHASWLNRSAFLRKDSRRALPLLAPVVSRLGTGDADVVVCSSSGWAHGVRCPQPKLVYCHNPARWLYQPDDYFMGAPRAAVRLLTALMAPLRRWDRKAAADCAVYVVNSTSVAERVERLYGRRPLVVHPPASLEPDGPQEPVEGLEPGYFLTVGRRRGYKRTGRICEAFAGLPGEKLVVVGGLPGNPDDHPSSITTLSGVTDAQLRWLYAHCRAVVAMSHEDFGLVPVEGFRFGRPCIALRAGGYLDSCDEAVTGPMVDDDDPVQLRSTLAAFDPDAYPAEAIRRHGVQFSPGVFRARMRALVDELAGHGPAAVPPQRTPSVDLTRPSGSDDRVVDLVDLGAPRSVREPSALRGSGHGRRFRHPRRLKVLAAGAAGAAVLAVLPSSAPDYGAGRTAGAADRLTWEPPRLRTPTTVHLSERMRAVELDRDKDYRLVLPARPLQVAGGVVVAGGRNVVLVGGEIRAPSALEEPDPRSRRGLLLTGQTGTVHVEGVRISGEDLAEGIDLDQRLGATVQLQNLEVGPVRGARDGNHADVLQTWAGPARLRVDGLRGSTSYQGLFLLPEQFLPGRPPERFDLRRVVVHGLPGSGYLAWTSRRAPWLSLQQVALVPPAGGRREVTRPEDAWSSARVGPVAAGAVDGPAGVPGVGYRSPGYAEGPHSEEGS